MLFDLPPLRLLRLQPLPFLFLRLVFCSAHCHRSPLGWLPYLSGNGIQKSRQRATKKRWNLRPSSLATCPQAVGSDAQSISSTDRAGSRPLVGISTRPQYFVV